MTAATTAELIQQGQDPSKTLTAPEKERLKECEEIIRRGLGTFIEVGKALAEIHDNRLYKETHSDFQKYCKDVWDLGQSTAYQKMDGYRAVRLIEDKSSAMAELLSEEKDDENLCDVLDLDPATLEPRTIVLPINERQVRPLVKLKKDPEAQLKAWAMVQKALRENPKAKLTGALVNKAVKEVQGESALKKINETKKKVESTNLVSRQFQSQYQVLLDIIVVMKNEGFVNDKRGEVSKYLKALVDLVESDD
jgi:hypothetical protein